MRASDRTGIASGRGQSTPSSRSPLPHRHPPRQCSFFSRLISLTAAGTLGASVLITSRLPGQDLLHRFTSESVCWRFADSLSPAGDLNGDGGEDLMIGEPHSIPAKVYLYSGLDGSQLFVLTGANGESSFGSSLAGRGDVDADGVPDLLVGAPYNNQGQIYGAIELFSGATFQSLYQITLTTEDGFGTSVAFIDDLDGDGADDLLVGAPWSARGNENPGRTFVYSGRTGQWIDDLARGEDRAAFGTSLATLGDVNGDGAADFAVGAPYNPRDGARGSVFLVSGLDRTVLRRFDAEPKSNVTFGYSVASAGDVNQDLVPDLIVGAAYDSGLAYVYSGADGALLYRFQSKAGADAFGAAVGGGSDLNLDGHSDFVVGAPQDRQVPYTYNGYGAAYVYSGKDGSPLFTVKGTKESEFLGAPLLLLQDTDLDGFPDLVVGATGCYPEDVNVSHVDLYSGRVRPAIGEVSPPRGRYDAPSEVTISGDHFRYFQDGAGTSVSFGSKAASDVSILDDDTIQCTVPPGDPSRVGVTVENLTGIGTRKDAFSFTPTIHCDASTPAPGDTVALHFLCDPDDFIYTIAGAGPPVSSSTPPFDGTLCIARPVTIFLLPTWPFDDLFVEQDLPDDPALSGLQILLQALIGPMDYRHGKNASWTNCVELLVE